MVMRSLLSTIPMPYSVPENPSPQLQPILEWVNACNALDVDRIAATMSDETYEHVVLPASIGFPPRPTKKAWLDAFVRLPS